MRLQDEIQAKYKREGAKPLYLLGFDEYGPLWSDTPKEAPKEAPKENDETPHWNFD
jgi:hypothetical protein